MVRTAPPGTGAAAEPPPTRGLRVAVAAFQHRNFTLFWTGALISNIGTWMQNITVPYVIYQMTGSASLVGVAGFVQFVPIVFVGPVGGSLADRFPRRRLLVLTQGAMAVVAFALWGAWAAGAGTPGVLIALVAVNGVIGGLNIPAWQAFVSELVPREHLLGAVTLNSAQFNAARAFGPAIGGVVLGSLGAGAAFLINAVSFAAVIAALALVRVPVIVHPEASGRVVRQFLDGLAYVRRRPGIAVCILVVTAVAALGMPVVQLAAVFAEDVFGVGAGAYGLLTGALGLGGALAAPVVTGWAGGVRRSRLAGYALVGYGAALVLFAQAPSFPLAVVAIALAGAGFLTVVSTLNTTVQLLVTEDVRGRVMAIYIMGFTAAYPVGTLVQGWLADRVGPRLTVSAAAAALVVAAVWLLSRGGLLARLDQGGPREATESGEPAPVSAP